MKILLKSDWIVDEVFGEKRRLTNEKILEIIEEEDFDKMYKTLRKERINDFVTFMYSNIEYQELIDARKNDRKISVEWIKENEYWVGEVTIEEKSKLEELTERLEKEIIEEFKREKIAIRVSNFEEMQELCKILQKHSIDVGIKLEKAEFLMYPTNIECFESDGEHYTSFGIKKDRVEWQNIKSIMKKDFYYNKEA